jgi:hypothetical protein
MKAYWGSGGIALRILNLGTDDWLASCIFSFTSSEKAPGTHWLGGWVGPRTDLDVVAKRKIPSPCRDSNPPIIQPIAQRYTTELYNGVESPCILNLSARWK